MVEDSGDTAVIVKTPADELKPSLARRRVRGRGANRALMALIEIRGASREFPGRGRSSAPVLALDDVDLDVEEADILGIVGYSGAGKSTLLRLVNALEPADLGHRHGRRPGGQLACRSASCCEVRADIGMIFQQFNLLARRTVWGNIAYPLQVAGVPRSSTNARISELLHFVGLADKAHSPTPTSSRAARSSASASPARWPPTRKILLADEPTSALDPQTTAEVLALLRRVNEELGITIVLITHEMEVVRTPGRTAWR